MVLDEATAAIDQNTSNKIFTNIIYKTTFKTVIAITHDSIHHKYFDKVIRFERDALCLSSIDKTNI